MSTSPTEPEMKPWTPARRFLTTDQAAELIGLCRATLEDWRWQRKGPPFVRVSAQCIRYDETALLAWLDAQTVNEIPKASGL